MLCMKAHTVNKSSYLPLSLVFTFMILLKGCVIHAWLRSGVISISEMDYNGGQCNNISFHELMPFRGGLRWLADAALSHYISNHQQKSTKSLIKIALISFKIFQSIIS